MTAPASVVFRLPGWGGAGVDRWRALPGARRVEQSDWDWPRRGDWMARLDEVLLETDDDAPPALLVAHGLGCQLVASWAAHTRHAGRVAAALLVAPHDTEADASPQLASWRPMTRQALPFASSLLVTHVDRHCTPERARALAACWGSEFVVGDGRDGAGDWQPADRRLLDALTTRALPSCGEKRSIAAVPARPGIEARTDPRAA